MGNNGSRYLMPHLWREDEPDACAPIKYDPQFGFEHRREVKGITLTEEEMDSANLEESVRDQCVYYRLQYRSCMKNHAPYWAPCKGLYKELQHCYLAEHIHDMKEFEREKRLNARERRLKQASQ